MTKRRPLLSLLLSASLAVSMAAPAAVFAAPDRAGSPIPDVAGAKASPKGVRRTARGKVSADARRLGVKVAPGASARVAAALREDGARVERRAGSDMLRVSLPAGTDAAAFAKRARVLEGVMLVAQSNTVRATAFPADPPDDPQYTLSEQYGLAVSKVASAWASSLGTDVVVAVVDTGVDLTHPDLSGQLLPGWNVLNGTADPQDDNGHGTHVAGIVAAATDNGIGVAGTAPRAKVLPVKVLGDDGSGESEDVRDGIIWATDHGADVVNLSMALPAMWDDIMFEGVRYAQDRDVVIVAASGNMRDQIGMDFVSLPAGFPGVLGVGGTNPDDTHVSWAQTGIELDVSAPAVDIMSTVPSFTDASGYMKESGTSMSTPLVAGAVALLRSLRPGLTETEVRHLIATSGVDLGAPGWDPTFGYSRLDANAALTATFTGDAYEPDNVTATAPVMSVGTTTGHTYLPVGESDAVRFEAVAGHTYRLETRDLMPLDRTDTYLFLFDDQGHLVAEDDDGRSDQESLASRIETTMAQSGTYHLVSRDAWDMGGSYTLSISDVTGGFVADRIAGASRYDTSVLISKNAYPFGADTVIVATGGNWPDALGGAALAGAYEAPILLLPAGASSLPATVAAEVTRLGADRAFILGGTGAVRSEIGTALQDAGVGTVTRLGGGDRYETASLVASAAVAERVRLGTWTEPKAFVATGLSFPDALGASPVSAAKGWPILLVRPASLPQVTADSLVSLGVTEAVVLGGDGAVSTSTAAAVDEVAGVAAVSRIAGANRYETASLVASQSVAQWGMDWDGVAFATGASFPDALAGGALQGMRGSVMLLTPPTALHPTVDSLLQGLAGDIRFVTYLGGDGAIGPAVRARVLAILDVTG